jgi:hypothetical protein
MLDEVMLEDGEAALSNELPGKTDSAFDSLGQLVAALPQIAQQNQEKDLVIASRDREIAIFKTRLDLLETERSKWKLSEEWVEHQKRLRDSDILGLHIGDLEMDLVMREDAGEGWMGDLRLAFENLRHLVSYIIICERELKG